MKLLPNEEAIISSNEDKIILTNYRIQMTDSAWGQSFSICIFLEDISSIEVKYKSNVLLIILGVICVLGSFYFAGQHGGSETMVGGLIFGGIFFAAWWFTREHIISISSDGGAVLSFLVSGIGDDKIADFMQKLFLAKLNRVHQFQKVS